jgi:hypothetical protein
MQRTSENIGTLAGALAKAQTQLINPEKSLLATIREEGPRGREQAFRYAPLSSGLEIVRKVLGQHEIATVQTTSIDQSAGLVNLTTVLAHVSGEWIASDWPVCPLADTASPRRMGAALTYARRYALFALVGITGEDDMDAPDLQVSAIERTPERAKANGSEAVIGQPEQAAQASGDREEAPSPRPSKLAPARQPEGNLGLHGSAKLRERLIAEIKLLASAEEASEWVRQRLIEKNRLRASDAIQVEAAFAAKLACWEAFNAGAGEVAPLSDVEGSQAQTEESVPLSDDPHRVPIDKSVLNLPEPRRVRDRSSNR